MNGLILNGPRDLALTRLDDPGDPGPGEARVRIRRCGICGTDISAYLGRLPFIRYPRVPGHELAVTIEAVGDGVPHLKPGDAAAVEPYLTCGHCPPCRAGRTNCCSHLQCFGVHCDGGLREAVVLPAGKLHPAHDLGLDQLALVEMLGIGKHAVDRAGTRAGDTVAVIGLGPIGLTAVQFARLKGARVVGVDLNADRCGQARTLFEGLDTLAFDPDQGLAATWDARESERPWLVFDATGNRRSVETAIALPGNGGSVVSIGIFDGAVTYDGPEFHRREISLLASRNSTADDFREIIDALRSGAIATEPWITHRAALAEVPAAFPGWLAPAAGCIKAMVSLDD
ncbi:MAG: zinc-binding alcohol dehydrogenase family protein [Opitutales bacterium]